MRVLIVFYLNFALICIEAIAKHLKGLPMKTRAELNAAIDAAAKAVSDAAVRAATSPSEPDFTAEVAAIDAIKVAADAIDPVTP